MDMFSSKISISGILSTRGARTGAAFIKHLNLKLVNSFFGRDRNRSVPSDLLDL